MTIFNIRNVTASDIVTGVRCDRQFHRTTDSGHIFFFIHSLNHWRIHGVPPSPPPAQQDPILSFSYTFSPKSAHVGGQRPPPPPARCPHKRKSWIRNCKCPLNLHRCYEYACTLIEQCNAAITDNLLD